jgi:hypothetical protein
LSLPRDDYCQINGTSQIFSRFQLFTTLDWLNNTCMSGFNAERIRASWIVLALLLSACNGTAVVTLTSTPSTDNFLAYRVGLTAIELQTSDGKSSLKVLPGGTTVDFVNLLNFSEVLGAAGVAKGTYTSAVMTLDYSHAQIIYDDGSLDGVALTPLNSGGQPAGQISVTATLDTAQPFRIALKQSAALAIVFSMGASNLVNVANKTVTVTPMVGASSMPIDSKPVRIRGPIMGVNSTGLMFTSGVEPFDGSVVGQGQLSITQSDTTTYEINGQPAVGPVGLSGLSSVGSGALAVSYGTLTAADTVTATTAASTSSSNVTFLATQILAGSSVQAAGVDRVTGIVTARSGNTLSLEAATLLGADGTNTFIPGATLVNMGPNTVITAVGETTAEFFTPQAVSVGAVIDAFGTASNTSSGTASLDASAGRIRVDLTTVSGLVTQVISSTGTTGELVLNLAALGGRSISAFDFVGAGAAPAQFSVSAPLATGTTVTATGSAVTTAFDLSNVTVGAPVVLAGITNAFGAPPPNFTATPPAVTADTTAGALIDPTVIQAQLVVDWGAGTPTPFTTFDTTSIDLDAHNANIGQRHVIQVGALLIDLTGLSQDPLISPNATGTAQLFSIGHAVTATVENFNTYPAFIAQMQTELTGSVLATGMSASGVYTASNFAFSATGITLFLNN